MQTSVVVGVAGGLVDGRARCKPVSLLVLLVAWLMGGLGANQCCCWCCWWLG